MSKIEWTEQTWNPVTGCSKVSEGCRHCYAETLSHRFGWTSKPWTAQYAAENVITHPDRLEKPLRVKKPTMWFVNSMSDLFHERVPEAFIREVFSVMAEANWHTFQILTKRPERMRDVVSRLGQQFNGMIYNGSKVTWPLPNVWLGTSAEDQKAANERIPWILQTQAAVLFISCEPLLGSVNLTRIEPKDRDDVIINALAGEYYVPFASVGNRPKIDWVIAGAESGHGARPMNEEWVRGIKNQCVAAGVKFFYKQNAVNGRKISLPMLDGRTWEEMPVVG